MIYPRVNTPSSGQNWKKIHTAHLHTILHYYPRFEVSRVNSLRTYKVTHTQTHTHTHTHTHRCLAPLNPALSSEMSAGQLGIKWATSKNNQKQTKGKYSINKNHVFLFSSEITQDHHHTIQSKKKYVFVKSADDQDW